jgi:hypothetical protein
LDCAGIGSRVSSSSRCKIQAGSTGRKGKYQGNYEGYGLRIENREREGGGRDRDTRPFLSLDDMVSFWFKYIMDLKLY